MVNVRRPREGELSILNEMLAMRLQELEAKSNDSAAFIGTLGIGKGTYYDISRAKGNPTFRTIERIAARLNMSVFELLGFNEDDARRALKRNGVDYDELTSAIADRSKADERVAAHARLRK
ncbi:MAG: XRE family transcriptional regulator [Beijerinckiaceae bacterium]|nr:XRE family transcriptional regulator [Beijerinckiaceae bacterium]